MVEPEVEMEVQKREREEKSDTRDAIRSKVHFGEEERRRRLRRHLQRHGPPSLSAPRGPGPKGESLRFSGICSSFLNLQLLLGFSIIDGVLVLKTQYT
ncbi:uncharacterized protein BDZ99DRAFT_168963 [Mytilinidion resinicola]|uniref:Uncharacterized protein n=1 Tax=Mytilinidion resinicola TaxID=574789 RepID=A0A6A6Y796_9PEZI|nr:uncharacterized protein BDZ99DRAFT_168963 [Mytilinidion resinicola]KAF2803677.1 hypothetical protein BDZ99DRAFT_168963 [Mytilinidion resinicola]